MNPKRTKHLSGHYRNLRNHWISTVFGVAAASAVSLVPATSSAQSHNQFRISGYPLTLHSSFGPVDTALSGWVTCYANGWQANGNAVLKDGFFSGSVISFDASAIPSGSANVRAKFDSTSSFLRSQANKPDNMKANAPALNKAGVAMCLAKMRGQRPAVSARALPQ